MFARPFPTIPSRLLFLSLGLLILLAMAGPAQAQIQDQVGIFWDQDYTHTEIETDPFVPLTGYLVILNPSDPSGVVGWEMCVGIDGNALILTWELQGQVINVAQVPCFSVGVGGPPLMGVPDVLLATFQLLPLDSDPIVLSLDPPGYAPSLPGEMIYLPASNPGVLMPLTTFTGAPESAWINRFNPVFEVVPGILHFNNYPIGVREVKKVTINNLGPGPIMLDIGLEPNCEFFDLSGNVGPTVLPGYQSHDFWVGFTPPDDQVHSCSIYLGETVPGIAAHGIGRYAEADWEAPAFLDFGYVAVGGSSNELATIINTGETNLTIDPTLLDCGDNFEIVDGVWPWVIEPFETKSIQVRFTPQAEEAYACQLIVGDPIPPIDLLGRGREPEAEWVVSPTIVEFEDTPVGSYRQRTVTIRNTGNVDIDLDVYLVDPVPEFSVTGGAGPYTLAPNQTRVIQVRFSPESTAGFQSALHLADIVPNVTLIAQSTEPFSDCRLTERFLQFGSLNIGAADEIFFFVENVGTQSFYLDPVSSDEQFEILGAPITVQPGEERPLSIRFRPLYVGVQTAVITLGPEVCGTVSCTGAGLMATSNIDLIGFYFDDQAVTYQTNTVVPNQLVNCYLVMTELSNQSGVAGWECKIGVSGDATMVSHVLRGSNINAGIGEEFIVGIAEAPLPYSDAVILGEFELLVHHPFPSEASLEIRPVRFPTIPFNMAWLTWDDPASPKPMATTTGTQKVAWVNAEAPLPNELPTLHLSQAQGEVKLSWNAPHDGGTGYHVYRREDGRPEIRLTDSPLQAATGVLAYRDYPTGIAEGAVLHYSYGVMQGSIEVARSPEVSIKLGSQVPRGTRLLANYPNPFNPQTEIPFELSQPGTVRLAIYDVTGKLIRTLVSESMDPGAYTRTWMGRDNAGRAVPSGAYYARLITDQSIDTRKMMLLR